MVQVKGRLQRGLLRLWVVLSLGWIGAVGYHAYSVWPNDLDWQMAFQVFVEKPPKEPPKPGTLGATDPDIVKYSTERQKEIDRKAGIIKPDQEYDGPPDPRWLLAKDIVRPHLKWAFGPPIGVLIIGAALWWAAAGFRKWPQE